MLGKGLESLIPKKNINQTAPRPTEATQPGSVSETLSQTTFPPAKKTSTADAIFLIEIENIKPNPFQPRKDFNDDSLKELADSIREFGIIQPLIISKIEKETETGTSVEYQLIAGERRLRAAQTLGWEKVPAIIKKIEQKADQLEMAIVENLQRADLTPIETARSYAKLQDEFGLTQREIGTRLGKSRETIANALRLLDLPTEIQDALNKGIINESQARLLLVVSDPLQQQNLFNELLSGNLSVRELRSKIRQNNLSTNQPTALDIETQYLEEQLAELLSAPVKIHPPRLDGESRPGKTEQGGKVVITFYSPEEIRGMIEKLK